jgi:hypothetical protein
LLSFAAHHNPTFFPSFHSTGSGLGGHHPRNSSGKLDRNVTVLSVGENWSAQEAPTYLGPTEEQSIRDERMRGWALLVGLSLPLANLFSGLEMAPVAGSPGGLVVAAFLVTTGMAGSYVGTLVHKVALSAFKSKAENASA